MGHTEYCMFTWQSLRDQTKIIYIYINIYIGSLQNMVSMSDFTFAVFRMPWRNPNIKIYILKYHLFSIDVINHAAALQLFEYSMCVFCMLDAGCSRSMPTHLRFFLSLMCYLALNSPLQELAGWCECFSCSAGEPKPRQTRALTLHSTAPPPPPCSPQQHSYHMSLMRERPQVPSQKMLN